MKKKKKPISAAQKAYNNCTCGSTTWTEAAKCPTCLPYILEVVAADAGFAVDEAMIQDALQRLNKP